MSLDNPDFVGAAQSALAGMPQQSQQPAQAPQPPAPVAPLPQTFFGKLLQGALNGLAGGLKQGQENVAGAGTAGFTPGGNGLAYAQQLQAKQDADRQAQAQQANQQGQQDFENQRATFKDQQDAITQKAQLAQTQLNGIHQAQQIHHASQEDQDKYDSEQRAQIQDAADQGITQHVIKPEPGQSLQEAGAAWLQSHPDHATGAHVNYKRDADGNMQAVVSEDDPNRQVSSADINRGLKSVGSSMTVPPGTSMKLADARHLYTSEGAKQADEHNKMALQNNANANAIKLANITQAGEDRRQKVAQAAAGGNPDAAQTLGEGIIHSGLTEDAIPGFAKAKPAVQAYLAKTYPNLDQASVMLTGTDRKMKTLANNALENLNVIKTALKSDPTLIGKMQGLITNGELKVGTDDPELGKIKVALDNYGLASTGAHAVRSESARADAKEALLNSFHNGPNAINGAMDAATSSLTHFSQLGRPQPMDPSKDLKGQPISQSQPVNQGGSGKVFKMSDLRNAPAFKGKSDDFIRDAAKKAGHGVQE